MTEKEARRYFNRAARYYERGLPPTRERYAIHLPNGTMVVADSTAVLWDRFWEAIAEAEKGDA